MNDLHSCYEESAKLSGMRRSVRDGNREPGGQTEMLTVLSSFGIVLAIALSSEDGFWISEGMSLQELAVQHQPLIMIWSRAHL